MHGNQKQHVLKLGTLDSSESQIFLSFSLYLILYLSFIKVLKREKKQGSARLIPVSRESVRISYNEVGNSTARVGSVLLSLHQLDEFEKLNY